MSFNQKIDTKWNKLTITNAEFINSELNNAIFDSCIFKKNAVFTGCKLKNVSFHNSEFEFPVFFIKQK